jgi:outer membrane protein assembly factor BamB
VLHTILLALAILVPSTQEWPGWRGPGRDAVIAMVNVPTVWPERLTLKWKVSVGAGYSSPVVGDGRVFVHARQGEREVVAAYDMETGKRVWEASYAAPYRMNPAAASHGPGPKSTPLLYDGKLYTFGISGILSAFDARTGALRWQKPAAAVPPLYGVAMSPAADAGFVVAHVGGHDAGALTAFVADTGAVKWEWKGDGPAYASPVITSIGGTRQIVTQTQNAVVGMDAGSGQLLWRLPFRTAWDQNSVTPVVWNDVVIFSGLDSGITAVRVTRRGAGWHAEELWKNESLPMYMSSPVLSGNSLFGLSHRNKGQLFCLDARTGKALWATRGREAENAALLRGGDVLFVLKDNGELVVARSNTSAYEPLRTYQVATTPTWAHPAIVGRQIFVKDSESLASWTF